MPRPLAPRVFAAIFILPGTALVLVPALLVWLSHGTNWQARWATPVQPWLWLGVAAAAVGLSLMVWTMTDFARRGRGTPAPWDQPQRLVVTGPYRHLRNPMITGVALVLLGEACVLNSLPIALWLLVFATINAAYMPLSEEPGLERRFGEAYRTYKRDVPRWWPTPRRPPRA